MSNLNSIKLLGEGIINNGEYDKITICGEASAIGDFKCNYLKVLGNLNIKEKATAKDMKILGEVKSQNEIKVEESLTLLGQLKTNSPCYINNFKVLGQGKFKDSLSFERLNVLGEITTFKDCEGNIFESNGRVKIEGLLSAESITIKLNENCYIDEIGGSAINVKKGSWYSFKHGILYTNLIEGDTVVLEDTTCKVVRGHNVTILDGCVIGKVEYTGHLSKSPLSSVKEEVCLKN